MPHIALIVAEIKDRTGAEFHRMAEGLDPGRKRAGTRDLADIGHPSQAWALRPILIVRPFALDAHHDRNVRDIETGDIPAA
jgi:hypothetical protein